jgi:DNA-binding XRE family transcriptional regulator
MRSCWRWKGAEQGDYGAFAIDGDQVRAHRYAWSFAYGEIPTGMLVLHGCDNSWCVNPRHLRVGTHEDNNADKSVLTRVLASIADADREQAKEAERMRAPAHTPLSSGMRPIHANIKRHRIARGMTQSALANACGATKSCVCHWEKGLISPTGKRLPSVAAALGVTVGELFADHPVEDAS